MSETTPEPTGDTAPGPGVAWPVEVTVSVPAPVDEDPEQPTEPTEPQEPADPDVPVEVVAEPSPAADPAAGDSDTDTLPAEETDPDASGTETRTA
ncbi:hypothetical protein PV367_10675 [Streptomyces europaeiscabiei]|uniref:Uncharacterized protein n=1 Tax=Streptomyces europaeiscabiei TaxID=146819 RepID=A0AAJ2UL37_9ACTN|nr:hypothetical protein [Streptomyces europaeiscabiei]MDX3130246.1 hypothetical protein [Streptomyces europaeiscabiei]